jgi:hypothetical protein
MSLSVREEIVCCKDGEMKIIIKQLLILDIGFINNAE